MNVSLINLSYAYNVLQYIQVACHVHAVKLESITVLPLEARHRVIGMKRQATVNYRRLINSRDREVAFRGDSYLEANTSRFYSLDVTNHGGWELQIATA